LKRVQLRLGLKADGILGPDTLSRIESLIDHSEGVKAAQSLVPVAGNDQMSCSRSGLQQIVRFEIASETYYRRFLSHPIWPKGRSGITIGIGYDLGYQSASRIRRDWRGLLADTQLERLEGVAGLKGDRAAAALATVADITTPLTAARQVYYTTTLPACAERTRRVYPGVEQLPADAQAMLLSLIYNRGASLQGDRRREMKAIVALVVAGDLKGIAVQVRAMKRLWGEDMSGLLARREREAAMIECAHRDYAPDELIYL